MECTAFCTDPAHIRPTEPGTISVPSTEFTGPRHSKHHLENETRASPTTSPFKRKAGSASCGDEELPAKRGRVDGLHHHRRSNSLPEQSMGYMSTSFKHHPGSDPTQRDQQTRTKPHQTDRACKPARAPARRYTTSTGSEIDWLGGSVKGVPRPLAPNPKPLCMIPFDVLMSDARTGKFKRAHEPVFVYLAVAIPKAEIRIRLIIEGTPQAEMKARRFRDGKPITKGDLAMSIVDEVEKVFITNNLESSGELIFVELVQECPDTFRPNFKTRSGGDAGALSVPAKRLPTGPALRGHFGALIPAPV